MFGALNLLPQQCTVCHTWSDGPVCPLCIGRFAAPQQRCLRCATVVAHASVSSISEGVHTGGYVCGRCLHAPPAFDTCITALDYACPWDTLLHQFKFQEQVGLVHVFAPMMTQAIHQHAPRLPDLILPVPLSTARLRERGYNQAALLAQKIAQRLLVRLAQQVLVRPKDTAHQLGLNPSQRQRNVRDAFAIVPAQANALHSRHIALVDDVMTTGATANEITRLLKSKGAASVQLWVAARTPSS